MVKNNSGADVARRGRVGRPTKHAEGNTRFLGVTVPAVLVAEIDEKAAAAGVPRSDVVTAAIREFLAEPGRAYQTKKGG